jgi:hypothetical protein
MTKAASAARSKSLDLSRFCVLADGRGKLAVENDEKVVYAKCRIGEQRRSVVATSPSLSNHNVTPIIVTARLVVGRAQSADFRQALMSINADESP